MSRLRLASRLAWRDVRRRKGRTLLVILLITIPVSAMAYGDGLYRTSNDQSATFVRRFGKIDLAVHPPSFADSNETGQVPPSKIGAPQYSIAALKASVDRNVPNATSEIVTQTSISLRAQDAKPRRIQATITDLRVDDPMNAGIIDISAGRAPTKQGEVLLSRQLARFFRVRVGDSLHFAVPKTDVVVVGVGRVTDDYQSQTIYAYTSSDFPATFTDSKFSEVRIHTTSLLASLDLSKLTNDSLAPNPQFDFAKGPGWFNYDGPPDEEPLVWGLMFGIVGLAVLGVIISAAFATSARRQLVTVGQLSSNGASEKTISMSLVLQGTLSGIVAAIVGITVGVTTLVLSISIPERILHHDLPTPTISWRDLIIIAIVATITTTLAALAPARSASKVPVLTALAGRRPNARLSPTLGRRGVACFALGLLLLGVAAWNLNRHASSYNGSRIGTGLSIAGALLILAALCCFSPKISDLIGRHGGKRSGAVKLACRSLGRSSVRTAGAIAAIAATSSFCLAGASVGDYLTRNTQSPSFMARNEILAPADLQSDVDAVIRDVMWHQVFAAGVTPTASTNPDMQATGAVNPPGVPILIVDEPTLQGLGAGETTLKLFRDNGAILPFRYENDQAMSEGPPRQQGLSIDVNGTVKSVTADVVFDVSGVYPYVSGIPFLSGERAKTLGFKTTPFGVIGLAPKPLTASQADDLNAIAANSNGYTGAQYGKSWPIYLQWGSPPAKSKRPQVRLVIAGLALLFTLLVIAIGLSLASVESRQEHDTLNAVGARPQVMSRVTALKAVVMTLAGTLVAIPTGFLPIIVIRWASAPNSSGYASGRPLHFPWLIAGELIVVIPIIVGAVSWVGSVIARRLSGATRVAMERVA